MIPTRYIFWGVNALLAAAIAYAASGMAARLLEGALIGSMPPAVQKKSGGAAGNNRARLPLTRFQTVLDANVFRAKRTVNTTITAPSTARKKRPAIKSVDPGKLPIRLSLTGTIVMGADSIAFVLAPGERKEGVYHLEECMPHAGDKPSRECTPAQAKLAEVKSDRITVVMNQNRYVVKFEQSRSSRTASTSRSKPRLASSRSRRTTQPAFSSITKGNVIETRIPAAEVEKAFENFAQVVNQARVVPYMVDGVAQGFQIRKIVPGSIYQRLGLRNSDIIKSVNGESLTTADQALRLFSLFKNEREISLEIQRGSKPFTLNYIVE